MDYEIVYLGHGNRIDLILKEKGKAVDLTGIETPGINATRMTLSFEDILIDSDNGDMDPIKWAKQGYARGEVRISLGSQVISPGSYRAPLVVYDPSNPDGIVWGRIPIQIEEEVEAG